MSFSSPIMTAKGGSKASRIRAAHLRWGRPITSETITSKPITSRPITTSTPITITSETITSETITSETITIENEVVDVLLVADHDSEGRVERVVRPADASRIRASHLPGHSAKWFVFPHRIY